jgi:hypothetical protein
MKSIRFRKFLLLVPLLAFSAFSASAGGKTHVGAAPDQMLNLVVFAPADLSSNTLRYDLSGPDFTVPDRMVFIVTDIHIIPQSPTSAPTDSFGVLIGITGRGHFARFFGTYNESFTTGLVFPAGSSLTAANDALSADDVLVTVRGYLTKGTALAPNTGF